MTIVLCFGLGALALLGLVVVLGNHMLRNAGEGASIMGDALGNFIDVFDPARARADRDLESKEHEGDVLPNPDGDDQPVTVDLNRGTARVRRQPRAIQ